MTPFLVGLVIVIVAMAQATKTIGPISDPEPRGGFAYESARWCRLYGDGDWGISIYNTEMENEDSEDEKIW